MVNPNVNVGIGTNMALAKLHVLGDAGIRVEALTPNNPDVSDAFMRIQAEVPDGDLPDHIVNGTSFESTEVGSRVTGRRFGHLFMDIIANEDADAFAVRIDDNDNGAIDRVPFIVRASGNVGIGQLDPQRIFNTNGQIRFENLPASNRVNLIGVDGNGDVFVTPCGCNSKDEKGNFSETEIEDLRTEVEMLKEELRLMQELISNVSKSSESSTPFETRTKSSAYVNVFPNPTSTGFNIEYDFVNIKSTGSALLVFYNSIGQLIHSINISEQTGNYYFEPDNSENGFYFCNVIVDDEVIEVKQLVYTK